MQVYESMPLCLIMFKIWRYLKCSLCFLARFAKFTDSAERPWSVWKSVRPEFGKAQEITGDHRSLAVKIWTQSIQFHRPRLCFSRRAHLQLYTAFSLHQGGSPHHSFTYFYSFWHVITVLRQLLLVITPLTFLYWPGTIYFTFLAESLLWLFALEIQLCQPLPSLFQR